MMRRLRSGLKVPIENESSVNRSTAYRPSNPIHSHTFESANEIQALRESLLGWYDANKRQLQWRELAKHKDPDIRGYCVLVSEIMLQQTQVATVESYYAKWIKKWPNMESLSRATLEQVNELWSGLGYYSRGRRLQEAAHKVVNEMGGIMPRTAEELQRQLPGVGPYTAAAIASIAFDEPVGLVDGNVTRVMTRLCAIGADVRQKNVVDAVWQLANKTVDPKRPGDFNQSLMELGATVCTPKSPRCTACPVSRFCKAYRRACSDGASTSTTVPTIADMEDVVGCPLCFTASQPWNSGDGVLNYPRKSKKTAAKPARDVVLIVHRPKNGVDGGEYLLWQRPATGLLANLWEFPSLPSKRDDSNDCEGSELRRAEQHSKALLPGRAIERLSYLTDVSHQFSHISQTYAVYYVAVAAASPCESRTDNDAVVLPQHYQSFRWVNSRQISTTAISTGMRKVFRGYLGASSSASPTSFKRKAQPPKDDKPEKKTKRSSTKRPDCPP